MRKTLLTVLAVLFFAGCTAPQIGGLQTGQDTASAIKTADEKFEVFPSADTGSIFGDKAGEAGDIFGGESSSVSSQQEEASGSVFGDTGSSNIFGEENPETTGGTP